MIEPVRPFSEAALARHDKKTYGLGDVGGIEKGTTDPNIPTKEHTGGSSSYYRVTVEHPMGEGEYPRTEAAPYTAECLDIIHALELSFDEGNAFKALWRRGAERQGRCKAGNTALYDAEKVAFFGASLVKQEKNK